ncbi:MAG: hypothetical protein ROO71_09980 [Balneola sp.]
MKHYFKNLAYLLVLLTISGCAASSNFGDDAEANKTQTRTFESSSFDSVYRAAVQVAASQNWSIKNSDKDAGYFSAETPGSMRAWSDEVNVTISEENDQIIVTVKSNLGQKPNRDIVSKYLIALETRLSE